MTYTSMMLAVPGSSRHPLTMALLPVHENVHVAVRPPPARGSPPRDLQVRLSVLRQGIPKHDQPQGTHLHPHQRQGVRVCRVRGRLSICASSPRTRKNQTSKVWKTFMEDPAALSGETAKETNAFMIEYFC